MQFFVIFTIFAAFVVTINGITILEAWTQFKTEFGRKYTLAEDAYRLPLFEKSLLTIEAHNAKYKLGLSSYFLTRNKFADWTQKELTDMLNRQAATQPIIDGIIDTLEAPSIIGLSTSVDWREQNAVLPVRDQGKCGSCWAFSANGAIEGQNFLKNGKSIVLSVQELVDCSSSYGNSGCNGGVQSNVFEYVKDNGLSSDSNYHYTAEDGSCIRSSVTSKAIATLKGYQILPQSEAALAIAVATVGPISVAVNASTWAFYGGGIYDDYKCGRLGINHAVLDVGYKPGYWILKNSWGEDWGESGYMRMVRGKNMCNIIAQNVYPIL